MAWRAAMKAAPIAGQRGRGAQPGGDQRCHPDRRWCVSAGHGHRFGRRQWRRCWQWQYLGSSATAIANQLNVVVNGNYNTVVVNSRQTNNGNVTANATSSGVQSQTSTQRVSGAGNAVTGMESAGRLATTLRTVPAAPSSSSDPDREQ